MNRSGIHLNGTNGDGVNGHATNAHHVASSDGSFRPIAICDMACRLPGGIASPEQLREFLIEGSDARSRAPEPLQYFRHHSPDKKPGATNTEFGRLQTECLLLSMIPRKNTKCNIFSNENRSIKL
jgi:hypothetical protein